MTRIKRTVPPPMYMLRDPLDNCEGARAAWPTARQNAHRVRQAGTRDQWTHATRDVTYLESSWTELVLPAVSVT